MRGTRQPEMLLKYIIPKNLPPPEPEDDPRFEICDDFAKLLGIDHRKYPTFRSFFEPLNNRYQYDWRRVRWAD